MGITLSTLSVAGSRRVRRLQEAQVASSVGMSLAAQAALRKQTLGGPSFHTSRWPL